MKLQACVLALDASGWQESPDGPDEQLVHVDNDLAMWARGQATELDERVLREMHPQDTDLDALSAFWTIAAAK